MFQYQKPLIMIRLKRLTQREDKKEIAKSKRVCPLVLRKPHQIRATKSKLAHNRTKMLQTAETRIRDPQLGRRKRSGQSLRSTILAWRKTLVLQDLFHRFLA